MIACSILHLASVFALGLAFPGSPAEPSLESRIKAIAVAHKGKVAIAVKNLDTGESFAMNGDEVMPTASLIKLPVMVEAYWQAHEGKVKLDALLTLKKDPKVKGSGILVNHFSDGATFPLRDAIRLMIVYSDNMATNMVVDEISLPATTARMTKLGLTETRLNAKVFRADTRIDQERGKKYGLGSTTANESVRLLEMIHTGKVVSEDACKDMIGHLKACDDKEKFTRFLPQGTVVAHKTGSVDASKTDAGIIYVPDTKDKKKTRPIAICVLTNENADQRWVLDNAGQVTIAKIAKEVYDYFGK